MIMRQQLLGPGVEYGNEAQLTAQLPLRVGGEVLKNPCHNGEELTQEPHRIGSDERVEPMRQREDSMEIGHRQQFRLPALHPLLLA